MYRKYKWLLIITIIISLFICPTNIKAETNVNPNPKPNPKPVLQHVFIISADGLNYEGFVSVNCNNLRHMAREGIMDEKSLALNVDTIEAAQASFLTGTFPNEHKFITSKDKVQVESLFDVLKKNGRTFAIIDGSGGKLRPLAHSDNSYVALESNKSDKEVLTAAYNHFEKNSTFLTYIYLNDCMEKLLTLDEKAYYNSVKHLDQEIGDFLTKLRKKDLYYNSLIIITSPRSSSPSDMVPLIIQGPGCNINLTSTGTMVLDALPTITKLAGIPKPYSARGIPIYEAIDIPADEKEYMMKKWISELKNERIITWNSYFDIQEELFRSIHQITAIKEEKQSIFNFVGEKEEVIAKLKSRLTQERLIYLGVFSIMLLGYYAEYRLLKKKFLLFR